MEILIPALIVFVILIVLVAVIKRSSSDPRKRQGSEGDSSGFAGSDSTWIGGGYDTSSEVEPESSFGEGFDGGGDAGGGGSGGDFSGGGDFGGGDSGGGDGGGGDGGGGGD